MATTNQDMRALTPKLRFSEFSGLDEWEERPLSDFLNEHKNKSDGRCDVHSVSVHKGIINQKEHLGRSYAAKDTSNYNLVYPHDVIYTKSPTGAFPYGVVKQNRLNLNVIVSPLYGVFTPTTPAVGYLIHCFFESPQRAYMYLDPITQKGAKNTIQITNKGFMSGMVLFPQSSAEQQKIADCLASLDGLIESHNAKLEALQNNKKGLLQQLFPAEGETVPPLRFPEFQGKWEQARIGEQIVEHRKKSSKENEYEVLTSSRGGLVRQREYYDNSRITERSNLGFNIIPKNYITYRSRSDDRTFYFNENNLGITGIVSTYYPVFRVKNGINKFFVELFSHHKETIGRRSVGTSQTVLSLNELKRTKLAVPAIAEQEKIANCLRNLDALINAETKQIASLKVHKRGLMQQLFPNPELYNK